MKKRLLFVMESMASGGGERSLLSLLQLLDYEKYDVDLFLFYRGGLFFKMLPEQVNVIEHGENFKIFARPLKDSVKAFLKQGKLGLAINRLLYSRAVNSAEGTSLSRDQRAWKHMKKAFSGEKKLYDAAVGYLEGKPNYFVADCVDAKIKIGYIHNDYSKLGFNKNADEPFFKKMSYLVSVSPECSKILADIFPALKEKVRTIENITSPATLKKLAAAQPEEFKNFNGRKLLTIGRLSSQKGYDIAVDAAEILAKKNVDFKWFAIGKGEMQAEIAKKIKEKNLEDKFILLGERANPYPYINGCDIYVQSSYYEGKSIAIDEAKCFAKPIVTTKFTTVLDQLIDEKTALLAEINAASVAKKIEKLLNDQNLQNTLSENLKKEKIGNEEEIEKFYEMLGD